MSTVSAMMVGMGDIHVAKGDAAYNCLGLGSCIGLVLYDPTTQVSGMIHVMLPASFPGRPADKIGKFADTGVPEMVRQMTALGAVPSRMVAAYAGGAQVFKFGTPGDSKLDVGARNVEAVAALVKKNGFKVLATDTGGSNGRTVVVTIQDGLVKVRTVNTGEKTLCNLKG
ncbi:MAG: chemotaxis protein CheD [Fimbriimonadaceae bacterium]|nr:chemotaxis protein CheD [Fimbriimonadaceae bacterium]